MALQKSTITIPLGLGINTKTDEKLVEQGQFNLVCENASFDKVGAVKKRQGMELMPSAYYNPDSASGASGTISGLTYKPTLASAIDGSAFLRCENGDFLYSHNGGFVYRNNYPVPECRVKSVPLYSALYLASETDSIYDPNNDLIVTAIRDASSTNGLAKLAIYDNNTGSVVYNSSGGASAAGASNFGHVRTGYSRLSGQSYYYLAHVDQSQTLKISVFNSFGQTVGSTVSQANVPSYDLSTAANNGPIAACMHDDESACYFIVPTTTAGVARFISMSGPNVNFNVTFTHGIVGVTGFVSSTARYTGGIIKFAFAVAAGPVYEMSLSTSGTISAAATNVFNLTTPIAICYAKNSNDISYTEGGIPSTTSGRWSGGVKNLEAYNTGIFSETFAGSFGNNYSLFNPYMIVSAFTRSYFLGATGANSPQKIVARVATGNGFITQGQVARVASMSTSFNAVAAPVFAGNDGINIYYNVNLFLFETEQDYKSNSRAILGKNIHLSGGFLSEFDGRQMVENGFHMAPPPPELTSSGTGITGTFSYKCVLKFVDKNGQVTRSAPSEAASITVTNKAVGITVPAIPFGIKPTNCSVEIYRTENNGSTYYLTQTVFADTMTSSNYAWSTTVTDSQADAAISDNTILYTTGDVLENDPAPACKQVFQGGNRLFAVGLEDENEMAYSKEKLFGECVNFSDFLRVRIDAAQYNTAGGLTAGGFMDDKIILFKENSIFFVSGNGPNETGANNSYTAPELISSETGCTDPRSVILTPDGIMFKGGKGIYLLNRGLATEYIGASIEEYNDYEVTSANHIDSKNLVVFSLKRPNVSEGVLACFDYFTKQWSIVPDTFAIDSDMVNGDMLVLDGATNLPRTQSASDFLDAGSVYSMRVKTPWIKVSGIQDFGRVWSCLILGKYKSAHDLIVKTRYDYDDSYVETKTITPEPTDSQYQYRVHLEKQKCQAVQFEIYDDNQTGESMELTALTLEVGLRKGAMKLPAARKY